MKKGDSPAEQHGKKLVPAGKPLGAVFGLKIAYMPGKIVAAEQG